MQPEIVGPVGPLQPQAETSAVLAGTAGCCESSSSHVQSLASIQVTFVDLKPIPEEAKPLSPEGFAVLVSVLVSSKHLDALELAEAVDDVDVATKV